MALTKGNSFIYLFIVALCLYGDLSFGALYELNTGYVSDSFKSTTTTSLGITAWDISAGFEVGKSKQFIVGISMGSLTINQNDGITATTFVNSDEGLRFTFFWDKRQSWMTALTYNLISKAKWNNGTSTVELRGTNMKIDLGYNFWITDGFGLALKITDYALTYTESVASTTLTTVSYSRSIIYPAISLDYSF